MTGFQLPSNFQENPESFLRKIRPRVVPPQKQLLPTNPVFPVVGTPSSRMATKMIREFSAPSSENVRVGPAPPVGDGNFELKPALINMVQASPFCGKPHEDANAHLQHFLEICNTFTIRGVSIDAIRLRLFPFSLLGNVKQWFYANREAIETWDKCTSAFLLKFSLVGKTNALRNKIASFQQLKDETVPEASDRLQDYISACPHHGMQSWFIIQTFYHGLRASAREYLDAAAGGSFFSLEESRAKALIEKMVENQGWSDDQTQPKTRGVHQVEALDMLAAKMDLLMKKLEAPAQETVQAMDARMTCEVCGNTGHSGNDCPETREDAHYVNNSNNNGYRPNNYGNQGWNPRPNLPFERPQQGNNFNSSNFNNQPSLRDLVFGQMKMTENINKKFAANDKTLESIDSRMESFSSAMKSQLSFNKMIETQVAQLAAAVPVTESGKIPGQPEPSIETVKAVTTRHGKMPHSVFRTNHAGKVACIQVLTPRWTYLPRAAKRAIIKTSPDRKEDPGVPIIQCTIWNRRIDDALCDLGASVNIMSKVLFKKLRYPTLSPTTAQVQLADSTIRYPEGVIENVPVRIWGRYVPVDFVVLDTGNEHSFPLVLGRPFLNTTRARIDMDTREISFRIDGRLTHFKFQPREEKKTKPLTPEHRSAECFLKALINGELAILGGEQLKWNKPTKPTSAEEMDFLVNKYEEEQAL